jgi:flagellar protein FlaJ
MGKKKMSKKKTSAETPRAPGEGPKRARKIIQQAAFLEGDDDSRKMKAEMTAEQKKKYLVIGISLAAFLIFAGLAGLMYFSVDDEDKSYSLVLYSWDSPVDEEFSIENKIEITFLSTLLIGILCFTGPVGFYYYLANRKIINLEDRLGDFLRDLAESARSGQTLHQSIRTASGGDYGSLSPEIKTMAQQISWGVAATDAMAAFGERVKTPLVLRAVTLIIEASNAGGEVSKVLDAAATDTREIQLLRKERKVEMGMYVMVIFIAFFVFLVVIAIVYATFVPQMKKLAGSFSGGGGMAGGMDPSQVDFDEVKLIYMMAGAVNGVGCGMVAGLMGSGRITDGFKFVFVFVLINLVAFSLLLTG